MSSKLVTVVWDVFQGSGDSVNRAMKVHREIVKERDKRRKKKGRKKKKETKEKTATTTISFTIVCPPHEHAKLTLTLTNFRKAREVL